MKLQVRNQMKWHYKYVADMSVKALDDSQTTMVRLSQTISNLEKQLHASKICLKIFDFDLKKVLVECVHIQWFKNMP